MAGKGARRQNSAQNDLKNCATSNAHFRMPLIATSGAFAPIRSYVLGLKYYKDQETMPNRRYNPKSDSWTLGTNAPSNRINFVLQKQHS
jgi:hypothetical protein